MTGIKEVSAYETPGGNQYNNEQQARFEMTLEIIDEKAQVANTDRVLRGLLNQGLLEELRSALTAYEVWTNSMRQTESGT